MAAASTAPTLLISLKLHPPSRKPNPNRILTNSRPKTWALNASSFKNGSPPETECPVPWEQQPVNEYQSLSTSFLFSWAAADIRDYISRLALIGSSFAILIGLPVAAFGSGAVADPWAEALRCALGAASAGLVAMILSVLRMYLGWAYVGNRLLSATVEYEETGWYDGQIWVKTPEVLARDRLLGSFSVKPVLTRVKFTLVGLSATLSVCVFIFFNLGGFSNIQDSTVVRVIPGAYSDESARSFEPGAFLGDRNLS